MQCRNGGDLCTKSVKMRSLRPFFRFLGIKVHEVACSVNFKGSRKKKNESDVEICFGCFEEKVNKFSLLLSDIYLNELIFPNFGVSC